MFAGDTKKETNALVQNMQNIGGELDSSAVACSIKPGRSASFGRNGIWKRQGERTKVVGGCCLCAVL